MIYEVSGEKTVQCVHLISAETPQEAAAKFRHKEPTFQLEYITSPCGEEWASLGQCEGCSVELFDGNQYGVNDEGDRFCMACCKKAAESENEP